jgi:hypothetical protein
VSAKLLGMRVVAAAAGGYEIMKFIDFFWPLV